MRLTLTILSGLRAGERILLGPGEMLRVGRTSGANIVISDDPTMSGVHYLVRCADDGGTVRDLESRNGLFLNGRPVSEAALGDGDQIRAGRTYFSVMMDSVTAGSPDGAGGFGADDETRSPSAAESTRAELPPSPRRAGRGAPATLYLPEASPSPFPLFPVEDETLDSSMVRQPSAAQPPAANHDRLYAVVDAAVARGLVREAKRVNLRTESLLSSGSSPYLAAIVPYLVEVLSDSEFLALWRATLTKNPGILIESRAEFDVVLGHARGLFSAKDDQGKQTYFRFYDPNILYEWLTTGPAERLAGFFGFASAVIVGLDKGERLLRLTYESNELNSEEVFAR
ncbi:MAG TPA: DUF4123 domain-containing protein [Pirellulales bacterium]|nr:DUF4123 domain-containing protein [Pirellulales bacterium]